jgi:hypothetical protein
VGIPKFQNSENSKKNQYLNGAAGRRRKKLQFCAQISGNSKIPKFQKNKYLSGAACRRRHFLKYWTKINVAVTALETGW